MFLRARWRLTAWYVSLMAVTLALIGLILSIFLANQAREIGDLELQLRGERLAQLVSQQGFSGRGSVPYGDHDDGIERGGAGQQNDAVVLESLGILAYALTPDLSLATQLSGEPVQGLPDPRLAQQALALGAGSFANLATRSGQLRAYSVPVIRDRRPIAVIQVAQSQFFVEETRIRLLSILLALGLLGLVTSGGAGFWLAGRTLQPIAMALRRQRDFVADASHELRTPLTVVRTNAEILLRHPDQTIAENQETIQDIVEESQRLGRLVSDLLVLARADSGQAQIAADVVDLTDIGQALHREVSPLASQKGLGFQAEVEPGVIVSGDRDRLLQLGLILLDNAIEHTETGVVTLKVSSYRGHAMLTVSDTGPGIAPEHLPHIFDRFYRADPARSSTTGGTGLGLAIARWIAEAHHGSISVTSAVGQGTAFTVQLPSAK